MNSAATGTVVGVSVTREFVEFCARGETRWVVNSPELFAHPIATLRVACPASRFVVELAGGWESGVLRSLQQVRADVRVAESAVIHARLELAAEAEVDANAVRRFGEAMWGELPAADRVERIVTAYAAPPRARMSWWGRLLGRARPVAR